MNYIDSHSHLYLEEFNNDLPQVIERARLAGVSHILLPNIDSTTINDMLRVSQAYSGYCFPMMGLHPTSVNSTFEKELQVIEKSLTLSDEYIAIGEIGLDLYWDKAFIKEQVQAFDRQIQLALQYNLPIVVHSREAFHLLYETILPYKNTALKGVFHSFTGTVEEAEKLLEFKGFYLGINGVVTFKNSGLAQALSQIPVNRIIMETDAPYLTPVPFRGKRNESAYLQYTLNKIADIYQITPNELAGITTCNTLKIFDRLK